MPNKKKDKLRNEVMSLVKAGFSFTKIGKMLDISRQRAQYFGGLRKKEDSSFPHESLHKEE